MLKGVILAGGKGTRLLPATKIINKHCLPILNKPMILYPIETLKSFGLKEILIVSSGEHLGDFTKLLGSGREYGIDLTYRVQEEAGGIAQALDIAESFASGANILVCLGDNIFDNEALLRDGIPEFKDNAVIFVKQVNDAKRFGVAEIDKKGTVLGIEEKPLIPKSNMAVTGLYYYPNDVFKITKDLKPSQRGEKEISDVNNYYIKKKRCICKNVNGFWSDAGVPESLARTTQWVLSMTSD